MLKSNSGAFTLIEVLIALSVLSISMLGVYSLLNMSIDTNSYAKDKLFVIEQGYNRVAMQINYPRKVYSDEEEFDGVKVKYEFEKESTLIPRVTEVKMIVRTDKAEVEYTYYEQK